MRNLTQNMGWKFVSILTAVVLWVVVLGSRAVEVSKEIPLEIVAPADAAPANDLPDRVTFRLSGPKAFLRAILDRREEPIRVNLAGAKPGTITYRFFADNIHLPIGVKVLAIQPPAISVKLEPVKKREVPLRVETRGAPAEGFHVKRVEARPAFVRLRGPESRIEVLSELAAIPVDVSGLKASVERDAVMETAGLNVRVDPPLPRIWVEIEPTSANFKIKNVEVRVQSNLKSVLVEKSVTVLVRASSEDLQSLDRSQVFGVVDLRGKPKGKYIESVRVQLPEGISFVRTVPERVTVQLQ